MKLKELLNGMEVLSVNVDQELDILDIVYDSRKVKPGSLFVAVTGFVTDGNKYIPMALEKGAVAVVTAVKPEADIPYVLVPSDRLALALLGANFYNRPSQSMKVIGITGTNGKTSSALLLKHVLETACGAKVGLVGTMGNMIGDTFLPGDRTTPESLDLQALFGQMRDAGCSYVVMEVSSHAIALDRVAGVHFAVAAFTAFTNLTEDHLDFHKTMEHYCDTKAELFARADKAVANKDDIWFERMCAKNTAQLLTTSVRGEAELQAKDLRLLSDGISFVAVEKSSTLGILNNSCKVFTISNISLYSEFRGSSTILLPAILKP